MAQDWRTVRVFISSTFKDMQAERDHLVRFVFPRLREELLKRRIHLVEVDLRWGVTSEQDALEVCKEIIDECRPRFVCILGGRYSWTPPGKHESITAGEVRHAILDHYLLNEYCFFYFRHPQVTASIPEAPARIEGYREYPSLEDIEAYCPEEAESRARRRTEKLKSLKQEVIDEGFIPCCYPARWDEAGGRLTDLSVFGEQVYQDLLWSIDDELGTEVPSELDEFAAEAAAVEAFIEERLAGYVVGSRQKVLDELTAFAESDGEPNVLVITGDAGTGKSAFLAKFYRDYVNKSPDCLVIPHFVGASVGSTDLRRTLRWMCHELSGAVGDKGEFPQDLQELLPKFSNLLQQSAASRRVVLIIDALNQIDAAENAHAMHWLPYQLPPNARIIVSTLEHLALDALRRREKRVRERTLEPLSENDSLAIVQGFLSRCHKEMTDRQVQALLSKRDSGNPLYLLAALEELRTLGTYEEITDRIKELPERVQDLFGWIFQRLEEDPGFRDAQGRHIGFELVRDLASLLAVSRYGLSQMELQELLAPSHSGAASPASPDPQGNVAALLRLLRPYLMHRVELLDFFHNQMREAAEAKYMQEESKRSAGHARLATYFRILSDPEHDESWKGTSSHAFSELPYHQTHAADWDNLMSTLESLFFLEGKIAHGLAFDILRDFTVALKHLGIPQFRSTSNAQHERLRLLSLALRRDIYFIARHGRQYPQSLFQCLWNSCWWYDCPQAKNHYILYGEPQDYPSWVHGRPQLYKLMEKWRDQRRRRKGEFIWIRSLFPPRAPLGHDLIMKLAKKGNSEIVGLAFDFKSNRLASFSHSGDLSKPGQIRDQITLRIWNLDDGSLQTETRTILDQCCPVN